MLIYLKYFKATANKIDSNSLSADVGDVTFVPSENFKIK